MSPRASTVRAGIAAGALFESGGHQRGQGALFT